MLRYIIFAAISFTLNVFMYLTAWLWAIIPAVFNLTRLPKPFHLLHTHEDDVYGSRMTNDPVPSTVYARWKRSTWWMMRNPGYGFDAYVLGVPVKRINFVQTDGLNAATGYHDRIVLLGGGERFGYRRDFFYRKNGKRYCKLWFGWHYREQAGAHMLKFDINPFKRKG